MNIDSTNDGSPIDEADVDESYESRVWLASQLSGGFDALFFDSWWPWFKDEILRAVGFVAIGLAVGFGLVYVAYLILIPVSSAAGAGAMWALLLVLLPVYGGFKTIVNLRTDYGAVSSSSDHIHLGGLYSVTDSDPRVFLWAMLAFDFGAQTAMFLALSEMIGIPDGTTIAGHILISVDNLMFGVLFDICELYGFSLGPHVEHTTTSSTVFFMFRVSFQLCIAAQIWFHVQARNLNRIVRMPMLRSNDFNEFRNGLKALLRKRHRLPWTLFDEVVFLLICDRYLDGDDLATEEFCKQFDDIEVSDQVRSYFIGRNGEELFAPFPEEYYD